MEIFIPPHQVDIVVDDIEKCECDWTDEYDDLLRDWTENRNEARHLIKREEYCRQDQREWLFHYALDTSKWSESPNLYTYPEDLWQFMDVLRNVSWSKDWRPTIWGTHPLPPHT